MKQPQGKGGGEQGGGSSLAPPQSSSGGKNGEKGGEGKGGKAAGGESQAESGKEPSAGAGASQQRPGTVTGEMMAGHTDGKPLPGGKLHDPRLSEKPVAPPPAGEDRVYIKMKGDEETKGRASKRLTLSPSESGTAEEAQAPATGIDPGTALSGEQAEEDAVRQAPVPSEYQEIIKRINSEKQ